MYRVVIIDDEMIIRVGFKSLIDWNAEGFVVAGEASNGLEGLELCRKVKPHVVFTDIVMAKLDGIGFIEQLLKDMPGTKVIVLSCLEEFGTLQKALRLGVRDYFLKLSFSPSQLIPLVRTLKHELDAEGGVTKGEVALPAKSELSSYLSMQRTYRDYVQKGVSPSTLPLHSHLTPAAVSGGGTAMFLIQRDGLPTEEEAEFLPTSISILYDMYGRDYPCDIVELTPVCLLMLIEGYLPRPQEDLIAAMQEVQSNLMRMMHLSVSIGAHRNLQGLQNFYPAYSELMALEDQRFYDGERTILIIGDEPPRYVRDENEVNWAYISDRVADALSVYDFQTARQVMADTLGRIARLRSLQRASVLNGVMLPLMQYDRTCRRGVVEGAEVHLEPKRMMASSLTLERLTAQAMDFIAAVETTVENRRRETGVRIEIEKAKAYVRDHLSDSINARMVADMLGFNYSYFSVLFKKETGMNFSDYLILERMRAAMQMLVETRLSVEDVANQLGYSDVSHFRKLFRNAFGKGVGDVRNQSKTKNQEE